MTKEETREQMIALFTKAWETSDGNMKRLGGDWPKGTRVGSGIDALIDAGFLRESYPLDDASGKAFLNE